MARAATIWGRSQPPLKIVETRPITGAEFVNWRTKAGSTLLGLENEIATPKKT
jgi:hypothetical protein